MLTDDKLPSRLIDKDGHQTSLVMDIARPEEADEIFEFLLEHYFPVPPFRQINFYDESEDTRRPAWRLDEINRYLAEPYSPIVRDFKADNQIVAVTVNTIEDRNHLKPDLWPVPDRMVGWLDRALAAALYKDVDLFTRYQTDRILHLSSGLVNPNYRRAGLLSHMIRTAADLAFRFGGAGAIKGDTFSHNAAEASLKLGFEVICTIDFSTFELPDGVRPMANFVGMEPFRSASLIARRLPLA